MLNTVILLSQEGLSSEACASITPGWPQAPEMAPLPQGPRPSVPSPGGSQRFAAAWGIGKFAGMKDDDFWTLGNTTRHFQTDGGLRELLMIHANLWGVSVPERKTWHWKYFLIPLLSPSQAQRGLAISIQIFLAGFLPTVMLSVEKASVEEVGQCRNSWPRRRKAKRFLFGRSWEERDPAHRAVGDGDPRRAACKARFHRAPVRTFLRVPPTLLSLTLLV